MCGGGRRNYASYYNYAMVSLAARCCLLSFRSFFARTRGGRARARHAQGQSSTPTSGRGRHGRRADSKTPKRGASGALRRRSASSRATPIHGHVHYPRSKSPLGSLVYVFSCVNNSLYECVSSYISKTLTNKMRCCSCWLGALAVWRVLVLTPLAIVDRRRRDG